MAVFVGASSVPDPKIKISEDGFRLSIENVRIDYGGEDHQTDLQVIQCNVSTAQSYVFANAYVNVMRESV